MNIPNAYCIPGLPQFRKINEDDIIKAVCTYFFFTKEELIKRNRLRERVFARHIAVFFLRNELNFSLSTIGKIFNQDHTTVIHSINKIKGFIDIQDYITIKAISDIKNIYKEF